MSAFAQIDGLVAERPALKQADLVEVSRIAMRHYGSPDILRNTEGLCRDVAEFLKRGDQSYDKYGNILSRESTYGNIRKFKSYTARLNQTSLIDDITFYQGLMHLIYISGEKKFMPKFRGDEINTLMQPNARNLSRTLADIEYRYEDPEDNEEIRPVLEKHAVVFIYADDGTPSRRLFRPQVATFVKYGLWIVDSLGERSTQFSAGPVLSTFLEHAHTPTMRHYIGIIGGL